MFYSISKLKALCEDHAHKTRLFDATSAEPDWVVIDNRLQNLKANYFNLGFYATSQEEVSLLFEQEEGALIFLITTQINGVECALLQLRSEPGLIGICNLTTTIQSTPSNFLCKHGGESTPYMSIVTNPCSYGKVLYDGYQYDWGLSYKHKTKRFLIVRVESPPEATNGFIWVDLNTIFTLPHTNHLITNDLRTMIPLLKSSCRKDVPQLVNKINISKPRYDLPLLKWNNDLMDSRGFYVVFKETLTQTREVKKWSQPLLASNKQIELKLYYRNIAQDCEFAVIEKSQPGLLRQNILFPAELSQGLVKKIVHTSAEGGRFWRVKIRISLLKYSGSDQTSQAIKWISSSKLFAEANISLRTSIELRMCLSMLVPGTC